MQFMLLVYNDPALVDALPPGEFDAMMRECFEHADRLREAGKLIESQQLQSPAGARSVRIRQGRTAALDGPFAEAKEVLGGFNLIDVETMEEACEIASHIPWAKVGCIEVRPVQDIDAVRRRVCAVLPSASASAATAGSAV